MKAIILIDLINDIVIKRGYLEKLPKDFFQNVSKILKIAREKGFLVIHVRLGFLENYENQPKLSPLFGKAHEFGLFKSGTEGTEFYNKNDILYSDIIINKTRVNPFYKTELENILKQNNISHIYVGGIATDLAVSSFVREAHDLDYEVSIIKDICASIKQEEHENELKILQKIAKVIDINQI